MSILVKSGTETHISPCTYLAPTFCCLPTSTSILGTSQEACKRVGALQCHGQIRNEGLSHIQQRVVHYSGPPLQRVVFMCILHFVCDQTLRTPREVLSQKAVCHSKNCPRGVGHHEAHPSGVQKDDEMDSNSIGHDPGYSSDIPNISSTTQCSLSCKPLYKCPFPHLM